MLYNSIKNRFIVMDAENSNGYLSFARTMAN